LNHHKKTKADGSRLIPRKHTETLVFLSVTFVINQIIQCFHNPFWEHSSLTCALLKTKFRSNFSSTPYHKRTLMNMLVDSSQCTNNERGLITINALTRKLLVVFTKLRTINIFPCVKYPTLRSTGLGVNVW